MAAELHVATLDELREIARAGITAMRTKAYAAGFEHPDDVADVAAVLLGMAKAARRGPEWVVRYVPRVP